HDEIRNHVDIEALINDPSANVRRATCGMLSSWNDEESIEALKHLAKTDPHPRVKIQAMRGLLRSPTATVDDPTIMSDTTWHWAREEATVRG
ncbi:MAG: HEAT repeat domain-containing protein, partial [Halobacteriaceae archaeon]